MTPRIDPEFRALIPPLSGDELAQLEENLKTDGCRDYLVTWGGVLVDGHNRLEICERHGIDYEVMPMEFADRDAAKAWIIRNQFGRRNLTDAQRVKLALTLKPLIAAKAKEKQAAGGKEKVMQTFAQPVQSRAELSKTAGVSHEQFRKAEKVYDEAIEEVQHEMEKGGITINTAFKMKDLPPAIQAEVVKNPEKAAKQVTQAIKQQEKREQDKRDWDALCEDARHILPPDYDQQAQIRQTLFYALDEIAKLPEPAAVIAILKPCYYRRLVNLDKVTSYLISFGEQFKELTNETLEKTA